MENIPLKNNYKKKIYDELLRCLISVESFRSHTEASRNYRLIIKQVGYLFQWRISTSKIFFYMNTAWHSISNSFHCERFNFWTVKYFIQNLAAMVHQLLPTIGQPNTNFAPPPGCYLPQKLRFQSFHYKISWHHIKFSVTMLVLLKMLHRRGSLVSGDMTSKSKK